MSILLNLYSIILYLLCVIQISLLPSFLSPLPLPSLLPPSSSFPLIPSIYLPHPPTPPTLPHSSLPSTQVEAAQEEYEEMISKRLKPDTAVFNHLISGLSRRGDVKSAFKYFNNVCLSTHLSSLVSKPFPFFACLVVKYKKFEFLVAFTFCVY